MLRTIKDFRVIHVPLCLGSLARHCFYMKEHKSGENTLFFGNVDFNGVKTTEEIDALVRGLFASFGEIVSISLSTSSSSGSGDDTSNVLVAGPHRRLVRYVLFSICNDRYFTPCSMYYRPCRFVHVVFDRRKDMLKAINATDEEYSPRAEEMAERFGLAMNKKSKSVKELRKLYQFETVDEDALQEGIDVL